MMPIKIAAVCAMCVALGVSLRLMLGPAPLHGPENKEVFDGLNARAAHDVKRMEQLLQELRQKSN